jgi:hypothetical protein
MKETSALYRQILEADNHWFEPRLVISKPSETPYVAKISGEAARSFDGTFNVNSAYARSDYINVAGWSYFTLSGATLISYCFYDENKQFVSGVNMHSETSTGTVQIPPTAYYLIYSFFNVTEISAFSLVISSFTKEITASGMMSLSINQSCFANDVPEIGRAVSGEIDLTILYVPNIPKMATLTPYVRVTDGTSYSEWVQKGTFFIDTREVSHNDDGLDVMTIHGYDAMLKFDQLYPSDSSHSYPLLDSTMVTWMASQIGVSVDNRTLAIMNRAYSFTPFGYTNGADIVSEKMIDPVMLAIGIIVTAVSVTIAYYKYNRKDIAG